MPGRTVFMSFTRISNPGDHRAYNEWHQLDHRPENLALPGVRYGERWVHTPACTARAAAAEAPLDGLHYLNAYWFNEPAADSVRDWQHLAEASLDEGRRPDLHVAQRLLMGFFDQIQVLVNPAVPLGPDAVVFRPTRGIHLSVEQVDSARSPESEQRNRWDREVRLPRLARADGVAAAFLFVSTSTTLDPAPEGAATSSTLLASPAAERGRLRVLLCLLDQPPVSLAPQLDELSRADDAPSSAQVHTLFRGALETIVPWAWDWFDAGSGRER